MVDTNAQLIEFKKAINNQLPSIVPETEQMLIRPNDNPLDPAFLYMVDNYILGSNNPELKSLKDSYKALPDNVKQPISIHSNFFKKPNGYITSQDQAQEVINLAQNYLDIPETNGDDIDKLTSVTFREKLTELQRSNPDINTEFSPDDYDNRAVHFLNALIKKRTNESNINAVDINETLIHLWALKQNGGSALGMQGDIGEAFALRNLMQYIENGSLPSGAVTTNPDIYAPWDADWTNNDAPDLFFNSAVYRSIERTHTVTSDLLFTKSASNPNAELLKQMAENIGIDTSKQLIFSEADLGRLAAEMLTHQAKELCIDEKDINNAIHRGDFMPHLNDLLLVEHGFGFPDELQDIVNKSNVYEEGGIQYEYRQEVKAHRSDGFAARYGSMDDKFVKQKSGLFAHINESDRAGIVRSIYESPASYFDTTTPNGPKDYVSKYERRREDLYLPKLAQLTADDEIGLCGANKPAPNDAPCTVDGIVGNGDCGANKPASNDAPCTVDSVVGNCDCGNAFSDAGASDTTTSESITTNISDTTGNEDDGCTVDSVIGAKPPCEQLNSSAPKR